MSITRQAAQAAYSPSARDQAPGHGRDVGVAGGLARLDELGVRLPYWCDPCRLAYYLCLPLPTPSNNVLREAHFHAYKNLRRAWGLKVFSALGGRKPKAPLAHSALLVVRHCAGYLDWDNASGGMKPLQDCLVAPTPRNPDGLGLVADDNPQAMPFPPFMLQLRAKREAGFTEVFVFALDPQSSPYVR